MKLQYKKLFSPLAVLSLLVIAVLLCVPGWGGAGEPPQIRDCQNILLRVIYAGDLKGNLEPCG